MIEDSDEKTIESVWDYPRPPRVEPVGQRVRVVFADKLIADSTNALRVLETSHPPAYYIPPSDIDFTHLSPSPRHSFCENVSTRRLLFWQSRNSQAWRNLLTLPGK